MIDERLIQQMDFISEIEKLKVIYRQNGVVGGNRKENSAEHSWHVAIMAIILSEYFKDKIDLIRVIKMLLIHDVVEIITGDTFLYDEQKRNEIKIPEKEAAQKIFGLLPENQKNDFIDCWNEFELNKTKEAQYANVLDNLQPIINHFYTNNQNIKGKQLTKEQIIKKKEFIKDYSEEIWEFVLSIIDKSVQLGLYIEK